MTYEQEKAIYKTMRGIDWHKFGKRQIKLQELETYFFRWFKIDKNKQNLFKGEGQKILQYIIKRELEINNNDLRYWNFYSNNVALISMIGKILKKYVKCKRTPWGFKKDDQGNTVGIMSARKEYYLIPL
jgi:hypothetical protein